MCKKAGATRMIETLKVSSEGCVLGVSLGLLIFFVGCSGNSTEPVACSTFDCLTSKFNLVTANLDGSDLVVVAKDTYREMTHPRITFDRKWIAYTRHNKLNTNGTNGCAEVKGTDYTNTELRATNMDGSVLVALTTPNSARLSTNSYWIDNTYNFTFLDGVLGTTLYPSDVKIKRSYRDSNLLETSVVTVSTWPNIFVADPQQVGDKLVFAGLWDSANLASAVKGIVTLDLLSSSAVPEARTVAKGYMGTLPASAVNWTQADENDPKLSPNGSQIAFMRRIDTKSTNLTYEHGFHIFVTSASGVPTPGTEIDISDKYLLQAQKQSLFYNDGVPEWIDETTLVFFTLNFTNPTVPDFGLEQKLFTMKTDGSLRTEIPLPAGYYYSDPIPYKDAGGKTRILFAANKSSATCKQ